MKFKFNHVARWLPLLLAMSFGTAQASLTWQGRDIDGNAVDASASNAVFEYDPNLDVTWFLKANTSAPMSWDQAMTWASALKVGAFESWSLPSALNQDGSGPCQGLNCVGSQLGYLLNVERYLSADTYRLLINTSQGSTFYWTSTQHALLSDFAYGMEHRTGEQFIRPERSTGLNGGDVIAMRPGDVATAVPESTTSSLALAGLAVSALALRRRTR